jgi:ParB-like chromosome segregation protein Spo0J
MIDAHRFPKKLSLRQRSTTQAPVQDDLAVQRPTTNDAPFCNEVADKVIQKIPLSALFLGSTDIDKKTVALIVESFRRIGQTTPIFVIRQPDRTFLVVSGNHRVCAARGLSWDAIDAIIIAGTAPDIELFSIAENLHRRPVSTLRRAKSVARWCELLVQVAQNGLPGGKQPHDLGRNKAAEALGFSRTEVGRLLQISRLTDEAASLAISLELADHQSALEKASRCEMPSQQIAILNEVAARRKCGRRKSVASKAAGEDRLRSDILAASDDDEADPQFGLLADLWSRLNAAFQNASAFSRERFVSEIVICDNWLLDHLTTRRANGAGGSR